MTPLSNTARTWRIFGPCPPICAAATQPPLYRTTRGLGWRNKVREQALKNIPFFGPCIANRGLDDLALISKIDKQFWQNINHVKVSGAGRTNYAIAKDDIGNWYVKSYSADPKDIIESAKKLAMFSLGGSLQTDLVNRPAPGADGAQPTPEAAQPPLKRVFDKHKEKFETATKEDFDTLKGTLSGEAIPKSIRDAWASDTWLSDSATETFRTNFTESLKTVSPELKEAAGLLESSSDTAKQGAEIVAALGEIRRFHNRLVTGIRGKEATKEYADNLAGAEKGVDDKEDKLMAAEAKLANLESNRVEQQQRVDRLSIAPDSESEAAANDRIRRLDLEDTRLTDIKKDIKEQEESVETARTELKNAKDDVSEAEKNLDEAKRAEARALGEVTRIVRNVLVDAISDRLDTVEDYEQSINFVGEAINPEESANDNAVPAPTGTVRPNI